MTYDLHHQTRPR